MQMSESGRKKLAAWEGVRCRAYRDAGGKLTIGVGHLLTRSELSSGKIRIKGEIARYAGSLTDRQVLDLLGQDLEGAENAVNEGVAVELSLNQFNVLVSFCFNVGAAAFKNSTLLRRLNQGAMRKCRSSCAAGSIATVRWRLAWSTVGNMRLSCGMPEPASPVGYFPVKFPLAGSGGERWR